MNQDQRKPKRSGRENTAAQDVKLAAKTKKSISFIGPSHESTIVALGLTKAHFLDTYSKVCQNIFITVHTNQVGKMESFECSMSTMLQRCWTYDTARVLF